MVKDFFNCLKSFWSRYGQRIKVYWLNLLIALDQFVNALFGGNPDETISAFLHRSKGRRWYWWTLWAFVNYILFFWQDDHCLSAYESEVQRKHLGKHYK